MIYPKIKVDWSFVLQESIIQSSYNVKRINNFRKKLKEKILQNQQLIFRLLSKYTGLSWNRKQINIWIFEGKHQSIPDPLLLNVYDYDLDFCIFEFIHMLVHILFQDNKIYVFFEKDNRIEETKLEAFTYLITKKIMIHLFPKRKLRKLLKKAEDGGFKKYIWDEVAELEKKMNLENKPIIKILKNKR